MKRMLKKALSVLIATVLLVATASPAFRFFTTQAVSDIPADAVEFKGHYYKVYIDSEIGWHDAKNACENLGGYLATATNEAENNFIYLLAVNAGVQCWLGGTDEENEGEWKWITGEEWSYDNGDFDNYGEVQHYLVINQWESVWDDQSEKIYDVNGKYCQTGGYVCEWDDYSSQINLIANDKDFENLIEFLEIAVYCDDDYSSETENSLEKAMYLTTDMTWGVYSYLDQYFGWESDYGSVYWKRDPDADRGYKISDPLKKFNGYAHAYHEAEYVDWILTNIFGVTPDRTVQSDDWYYFDGYYYSPTGDGGGPLDVIEILEYKTNDKNEYTFLISSDYEGDGKGDDYKTYILKSCLKEHAGVRYWTYTYCKEGDINDFNAVDIFYEKSYIADIWLNRHGYYKETTESKLISSILDLESISTQIYFDLKNNPDFKAALLGWNGLKIVFDSAKALEDGLSHDEIYEALILDLLRKVMLEKEDETGNVILDAVNVLGKAEDNATKYKGVVDDFVKVPGSATEGLLEILKQWGDNPDSKSLKEFKDSLSESNELTKKWSDNKFVKGVGDLAKAADGVADFYEKFVGYCLAVDMAEEMVILLKEMKNNTANGPFKFALQNVINAYSNADYAATICLLDFAENTTYNVIGKVFEEVAEKACPTYAALCKIYEAGSTFVNMLANTQGTIDAYYLCEATYNFMFANKTAIQNLADKYKKTELEVDAGAYVYAMRVYEQVYSIDLETTIKFVKAASEEGLVNKALNLGKSIVNLITGSNEKSSYDSVVESKETILTALDSMFWSLDNTWKFDTNYLKRDYPEIYSIYVRDELSKKAYTPTINSAYITQSGETNVEWSLPYIFYTENAEGKKIPYALHGIGAIDGVCLKEVVGSQTKTIEHDLYGSEVLSIYNEECFESFDKKYYLSTYSETINGNVYTNEASETVTYPIKKARLSVANFKDILRQNPNNAEGISFAIGDSSAKRYNIVYEVYRKSDDSDWSLIDVVQRDSQGFFIGTVYTDTTAIPGKDYSYRVLSRSTFDNGITLCSDLSNTFSTKSMAEQFSEKLAEIKYYNPRKGIVPEGDLATQSVATENAPFIELSWAVDENADFYEIYRLSSYGTVYKLLATVDGDVNTYSDCDLDNGVEYEYVIVPGKNGEEDEIIFDCSEVSVGTVEVNMGEVRSVTWTTGDRVTESLYTVGDYIIEPEVPQKEGYVFVGWSQNIPKKMPDSDLEFTAIYEKVGTASINKPSTTTVSYGDSLVLHANIVGDIPEGWKVEWSSASGYFDIVKVEADGKSCMITPVRNGTDAIVVTVYDNEGNVVSQDEQTITSNAGIFQKIIAFFKKLFGLTKTYPEIFGI